jgi:hypothetical protein
LAGFTDLALVDPGAVLLAAFFAGEVAVFTSVESLAFFSGLSLGMQWLKY